jgi:hypothetical protein
MTTVEGPRELTFSERLERLRSDPVFFAEQMSGMAFDPWQKQVLRTLLQKNKPLDTGLPRPTIDRPSQ